MLSDSFKAMLFENPEMRKIPIGCQSTAVHVFEDIIDRIMEENPYATIQSILESTDDEL
jgi:hypothetical protein